MECSHAQIILPKHTGWQPSVYTQDNSQSKFLFSVLTSCFLCCSWQMVPRGQKQHGFVTALPRWLLITARSGCRLLWCLSLSMLQLPPHVPQLEQQKMEKAGEGCQSSLLIALCCLGSWPLRSCISLLPLDSAEPHSRMMINSMNLARRNVLKLHYSSENTWMPLGNKYNNTSIERKRITRNFKRGK